VPPAFVLSQDQTLHRDLDRHPRGAGHRSWVGHRTATGCPTTLISLELLGGVPAHVPQDATVNAALAFDITVPFSRSHGPTGGRPEADDDRQADTHSAAARSGAAKERPCQPARAGTPAPASGPIILWVKPFTVKRVWPRDRSRADQRARIRIQERRPRRRSRPSTSAGATSSDGSLTRSSSR
jgi:hypothetical protein